MSDAVTPAESAAPAEAVETQAQPVAEQVEEVIEDTGEDIPEELKDQPGDSKQEKAEKAAARRRYELMVNGRKREVEIDFDNEEDVKRYLQKAFAADEKFQEAAMTRKQAEQLVEMLQKDPLSILKNPVLGLDVKELATRILNEELAEMEKTPEQKRLEELERKLQEKEAREKELENQRREAELQRIQAETYKQLDEDITNALASSDLPKSPYVLKRIADAMIEATEEGYVDVRVQDIMPYVEQQILSEIQEMFASRPAEVMERIVGKKNLDNYRKSKISKVKSKPKEVQQLEDTGAKEAAAKEKDKAPVKKQRFKDIFGAW